MLKASELKLQQGNYVLLDGTKEVEVIWQKYEKVCIIKVGETYPSAIVDLDRLSGIQINEEKLLKFGFEKSNRLDLGELKPCYAIFSLAIIIRHNSFFIDWIGGNTELKHVHQLQNLYFALTNQELTLK
jgi:hypothetical protein